MTGKEVIESARPGGRIAFDVVDVNNAVVDTVLAHRQAPFSERFKKYQPPPRVKIAVGDTVSVVIWESADNGLFGNSLTELSFPAGAAAQLQTEAPPSLGGVPALPPGVAPAPDLMAMLFGGTPPTLPGPGENAGGTATGAAGNAQSGPALGTAASNQQRLGQIVDLANQSGRPGTRIPDQHVGSDGGISIPYAGRIAAAGRTPEEVQRAIEQRLAGKALDPQALVVVRESAANSVAVAGEGVAGRRVPLSPGGDRLLQVIAAAGGDKAPVHDTFVQLSRNGTTASAPLALLVGDPSQNIYAAPGDVVTLVHRPQTFSVFGAAGENNAISFSKDRLSVAEALAKAGGLLDEQADARAVFLFRYEPVSLVRALGQPIATGARDGMSPVVYRFDMKQAKSYLLARRFPVRDKDVIFVANAQTQRLYYFFQALSQVTGPVMSDFLICQSAGC